jgi:hypothetical protein
MSCFILCIARFPSSRIIHDPSWSEYVVTSDWDYSKRRFSPVRAAASTSPRGVASYFPHRANAVQLRPRADTRAVPWQGETNCMASRRLHLAPSEALVSRGSQRAAGRPARGARAQLRDGR